MPDSLVMTSLTENRPSFPASSLSPNNSPGTFAKWGTMKILVVDDEPVNVALLEGTLADNGYTRVHSLVDSRLALEMCKTFQPDLILLDLMMPHVDGLTILEALRSQETEIFLPVLVLTADANDETRLRALRAGATDFLLKPFDQIEVLLRINNLLEIRRLHLLLDNKRAAFEDAVQARTADLRDAQLELEKNRHSSAP
jgi:DNA-binding response OmpR family regulator